MGKIYNLLKNSNDTIWNVIFKNLDIVLILNCWAMWTQSLFQIHGLHAPFFTILIESHTFTQENRNSANIYLSYPVDLHVEGGWMGGGGRYRIVKSWNKQIFVYMLILPSNFNTVPKENCRSFRSNFFFFC